VDYVAWNIQPCFRTVECIGVVGFIPALKREAFSLRFRKRVRSVTELWDDVCLLNRRRTDAGAGSHEFACGVSHALIDDGGAIIILM